MTTLDTSLAYKGEPTHDDVAKGDYIVIRGVLHKWSDVDPERFAEMQKIATERSLLEQKYKDAMRRLSDREGMLMVETRRRYPGK